MHGRWLMIDCGITFADDTMPGVDVHHARSGLHRRARATRWSASSAPMRMRTISAPSPISGRGFRCPVYATPFTAAVLRAKLAEAGLEHEVPITEVPMSGRFTVGPFELELITLTHSIPEPNAVVLRTPFGTVLHTGDWKFDPDPLIGPTADHGARSSGWATKACWRWSAIRPTRCGPARRAPRPRCARR